MKKYVRAAIGSISEESEDAKREIAINPDTDLEVLNQLAHDNDAWVRWNVARNPNISADLLDTLSGDSDWRVRQEVAMNSKTPVAALEDLIHDPVRSVEEAAAWNPNATQEIRDIYNSDIDSIKEEVTDYVAEALNDVIEDFLAELYDELPNRIHRYNSDWWNADSYFNTENIISRKDKNHYSGDDLEGMVDSIMFGNFGRSSE